jgi:hypothetical protein
MHTILIGGLFQIRTWPRVSCADYPAPSGVSRCFLCFSNTQPSFTAPSLSCFLFARSLAIVAALTSYFQAITIGISGPNRYSILRISHLVIFYLWFFCRGCHLSSLLIRKSLNSFRLSMRFFWPGWRVRKSSHFDRISIRRSTDINFLNAFSSSDQSKSSTLVIHFEMSVPPSCPSEVIEHRPDSTFWLHSAQQTRSKSWRRCHDLPNPDPVNIIAELLRCWVSDSSFPSLLFTSLPINPGTFQGWCGSARSADRRLCR